MEMDKAVVVSRLNCPHCIFVYQYIINLLFLTLQLAKDIISDLREILKQVRSTENKLRNEQEELENTIERALGKIINFQYSTFKLLSYSKLADAILRTFKENSF